MFYPKSPFRSYPLVESQLCRGNTYLLEHLLPWLSLTPLVTTYRVNTLKTSPKDFQKFLKHAVAQQLKDPPEVFTMPELPEIVCIGPMAKAAPPSADQKEIIVDSSCGAAVLRGAHIYSIGILGMQSGSKIGEVVNIFADLEGKCKKGLNVPYESEQKTYLGQGKLLMARYQIYRPEGPTPGIAVQMISTVSGVPPLGDLSGGHALMQNLPSMVCARVLNPQEGEVILDMCAAPGNKTSHLAELMNDRGVIVALDKTPKKIELVRQRVAAHGISCVSSYAFDSAKSFQANAQQPLEGLQPPFKSESFDRILLDAPCSALGNRPLLLSTMSPKVLESFPKMQKKLFANAVSLLKVGGTLVYSTCTVNIGENEEIVSWALRKYPELRLDAGDCKFGSAGWPCEGLSEENREKLQRFGPATSVDTVGFFIAKFVKS